MLEEEDSTREYMMYSSANYDERNERKMIYPVYVPAV